MKRWRRLLQSEPDGAERRRENQEASDTDEVGMAEAAHTDTRDSRERAAFGDAIRGAGIVGGSTAVNLAITAFRTKVLALLLGPEGMGLISVLTSVTGFVGSLSSLGIQTSGVREMAEAWSRRDEPGTKRTARIVLRAALLTGVAGAVLQGLLSGILSELAFGDSSMAPSVAAVGLVLLFQGVTTGRQAYLQGTHQLGRFAWQSILNATVGAAASIAVVAAGGQRAAAVALVAGALAAACVSYAVSWIPGLRAQALTWVDFLSGARRMYRLGAYLALGAAATNATGFLITALVNRRLGIGGVGLYSAAWSLSGMYVSFVLSAMGSDYMPRLVNAIDDKNVLTATLNAQVRVALLLGVPGILATLLLAPLVLRLFFSADFAAAESALRWFAVGLLGRLLSWPIAFVLVAAGAGRPFLALELGADALHIALVAVGLHFGGLQGVGIAFVVLYVLYSCCAAGLVSKLYNAKLSKEISLLAVAGALVVALVAGLTADRGELKHIAIAALACAVACAYTLWQLSIRSDGRLSGFMSRVMGR